MPTARQATHFRDFVIRPTIKSLGLWSTEAEELLLGTALKESGLIHRVQLGGGPARGLFQMEPATHDDIWDNYLRYHKALATLAKSLKSRPTAAGAYELRNNDRYAAAMARIHYKRAPAPLPAAGDVQAMAAYWKRYYNTIHGAGTVAQYVHTWNSVFT